MVSNDWLTVRPTPSNVLSINCPQIDHVTQGNPSLSDLSSSDRFAAVGVMITSVSATLQLTRSLVVAGRKVDIEGLDRIVGILCARALDLPADEGRLVRPYLAVMLMELDALSVAINAA